MPKWVMEEDEMIRQLVPALPSHTVVETKKAKAGPLFSRGGIDE